MRYTAVPWDWLVGELRARPAGSTRVLVDLAADKEAWSLLQEWGGLPGLPGGVVVGVVCPPGFAAGSGAVSGYTRHWIEQLRRGPVRPADVQLHALAAGAAGLPPGALVLPTARELEMRSGPPQHQPGRPGADRREGWQDGGEPAGPPAGGAPDGDPGGDLGGDPRPYIHTLATEGRHAEAAALAGAWEEHVRQLYGFSSPEAVQWVEIRADLARMAGDFLLATGLWMGACRVRLAGQGAAAPEVYAAAAGALYCWSQVRDRASAVESGPELVALLGALPALDPRHLRLAQARLEVLRGPALPRAVPT
ncbi:hypothetical protein [Streptomyces xanthophaeus]|uniref:hypothetical protein n=1 Tax=Streptomyces xanthophaeus TaxID=67385 RepID=UPI0026487E43|nr:hypothetical protein [Streptomyces xanthophaeus]